MLLSMNQGMAHLDNIWGCGGGNRPVVSLTNKVRLLQVWSCALFIGFTYFLESTGIFPVSGKSWKMTMLLENPGSLLAKSWKVREFARQ